VAALSLADSSDCVYKRLHGLQNELLRVACDKKLCLVNQSSTWCSL